MDKVNVDCAVGMDIRKSKNLSSSNEFDCKRFKWETKSDDPLLENSPNDSRKPPATANGTNHEYNQIQKVNTNEILTNFEYTEPMSHKIMCWIENLQRTLTDAVEFQSKLQEKKRAQSIWKAFTSKDKAVSTGNMLFTNGVKPATVSAPNSDKMLRSVEPFPVIKKQSARKPNHCSELKSSAVRMKPQKKEKYARKSHKEKRTKEKLLEPPSKRTKMTTAQQSSVKVVNSQTQTEFDLPSQQAGETLPVEFVNSSVAMVPARRFLDQVGLEEVIKRMWGHDGRAQFIYCEICQTNVSHNWHCTKDGDDLTFRCGNCQNDYKANNTLKERIIYMKNFIKETLSQMNPKGADDKRKEKLHAKQT